MKSIKNSPNYSIYVTHQHNETRHIGKNFSPRLVISRIADSLAPPLLIRSSPNLQVTRTGIKCRSSNSNQIKPFTLELLTLECRIKPIWSCAYQTLNLKLLIPECWSCPSPFTCLDSIKALWSLQNSRKARTSQEDYIVLFSLTLRCHFYFWWHQYDASLVCNVLTPGNGKNGCKSKLFTWLFACKVNKWEDLMNNTLIFNILWC